MPADARNDDLERRQARGLRDPPIRRCSRRSTATPDAYYVNLHNARFPGGRSAANSTSAAECGSGAVAAGSARSPT